MEVFVLLLGLGEFGCVDLIADFRGFRSGWGWTEFGVLGAVSRGLVGLWLGFRYGLVRGTFSAFDFG